MKSQRYCFEREKKGKSSQRTRKRTRPGTKARAEHTHVLPELFEVLSNQERNPNVPLLVVDELLKPENSESLGLGSDESHDGFALDLESENGLEPERQAKR